MSNKSFRILSNGILIGKDVLGELCPILFNGWRSQRSRELQLFFAPFLDNLTPVQKHVALACFRMIRHSSSEVQMMIGHYIVPVLFFRYEFIHH
jgi:hypothetical protein